MQRLFFSLKFSTAQQQQLLPYQQQALRLCSAARAVDQNNLHLTLFFLGQLDAAQQQRLSTAAAQLKLPAVTLTLDYLAGFVKPKILYLAPTIVPPELTLLQQQLATVCDAEGFTELHDRYRPHITLVRHGVYDGRIAVTPLTLQITEFALYVSENSDGKVHYRPLHTVKLKYS
jgi:RNA 2',3'-cyclic 3'-phosphodiesterase